MYSHRHMCTCTHTRARSLLEEAAGHTPAVSISHQPLLPGNHEEFPQQPCAVPTALVSLHVVPQQHLRDRHTLTDRRPCRRGHSSRRIWWDSFQGHFPFTASCPCSQGPSPGFSALPLVTRGPSTAAIQLAPASGALQWERNLQSNQEVSRRATSKAVPAGLSQARQPFSPT